MFTAPAEEGVAVQQNGRMNSDIFRAWLEAFVSHVHSSLDSPGLPIVAVKFSSKHPFYPT